MSNIKARVSFNNEVVASKVEVNTAGINLGDLSDVVITSPTDGSYVVYQSSSNTFLDDQTITKTATGINLTGELVATSLDISGNADIDGTLEADAITVNGITLAETISDTVGAMVGSNTESGIAITYDDIDNTLDFDVDDFTITLTGDVAGSGTVTNLGDVSFATTIQANSVALGTDTTGDYISKIVTGGGKGIALSSIGTTKIIECKWTNLPNYSGSLSSAPADNQYVILGLGSNGDDPFKSTLSAFQDEIYSNVSGDIVIAAGGTATIPGESITNGMLLGSIANTKLSNNTVSYGGVELSLGQADGNPPFNLSSAVNYPTSSLTGTITNAQLSGSITNSKLANSSVTVSDGSNTSLVALGGTLTFAGTSNEVTVAESSGTVTIGLPDDVTIAGDLSVSTAPTAGAHVTNKTYVDAQVSALVDSAPETLNTLNELADALGDNVNFSTETATSLGNRLRIDVNNQSLTSTQKSNARTNLGLGTAATTAATAYATAAQGTKADNALVASTVSAYGATIIDDADAAAARTTLGLSNVEN